MLIVAVEKVRHRREVYRWVSQSLSHAKKGVADMAFIEAVVKSSADNAAWTPLDYTPGERAKYGDTTLNSDRGGLV